jgi:hypothetical protein
MTTYWTGGGPGILAPAAFVEVHGTNPPSRPAAGTRVRVRDSATLTELTAFYDSTGDPATTVTTQDDGYLDFGVDDVRAVDVSADNFTTTSRLIMTNALTELLDGVEQATTSAAEALYGPAGLQPLRAALAGRLEGRTKIVVLGEDNEEGAGASPNTRRWVSRLQDALRSAYGLPTGGTGFRPAYFEAPGMVVPAVVDLTASGATATKDTRYGLGGRSYSLTKAGALVYSQSCTSFVVQYAKDPAGTNLRVIVDGNLVGTVNTNGPASGGFSYTSPTLPAGNHSIRLENGDPTVGYPTIVSGVDFRNGDEAAGIVVMDASHYGWTLDQYGAEHDKSLTLVSPDALIIVPGERDALVQNASAFEASLTARVARAQAALSVAHSVIILARPAPSGALLDTWSSYVAAMRRVAAATVNGVFVDLGPRMPAVAGDVLGLYSDASHFTNRGHANTSDAVFSAIVQAGAGGGQTGTSSGGAVASVNGQTGAVVLDASAVGAAAAVHTHSAAQVTSGVLGIAQAPTGSVLAVVKTSTAWPARPTARTDVFVAWIGADPPPPEVTTGTAGMYPNDIRFTIG